MNTPKQLISTQVDYSNDIDKATNTYSTIGHVSYNLYDPNSGNKIDLAKQCDEDSITVKVPSITVVQNINKTQYDEYINSGVNIYNKKSDFYNTRCFSFSMNNTQQGNFDVTLNKRRSDIFPNMSVSCGDKCDFAEIDLKNYTICNCISSTETKVLFEKLALDYFTSTNIDIFVCATSINGVIYVF